MNCGCKVDGDFFSKNYGQIRYCAVHEAASDLFEAGKEVRKILNREGLTGPSWAKLNAALDKAEGVKS